MKYSRGVMELGVEERQEIGIRSGNMVWDKRFDWWIGRTGLSMDWRMGWMAAERVVEMRQRFL